MDGTLNDWWSVTGYCHIPTMGSNTFVATSDIYHKALVSKKKTTVHFVASHLLRYNSIEPASHDDLRLACDVIRSFQA